MDDIAEAIYIWTEKHQTAIKLIAAGFIIAGIIGSALIEQGVIG